MDKTAYCEDCAYAMTIQEDMVWWCTKNNYRTDERETCKYFKED